MKGAAASGGREGKRVEGFGRTTPGFGRIYLAQASALEFPQLLLVQETRGRGNILDALGRKGGS